MMHPLANGLNLRADIYAASSQAQGAVNKMLSRILKEAFINGAHYARAQRWHTDPQNDTPRLGQPVIIATDPAESGSAYYQIAICIADENSDGPPKILYRTDSGDSYTRILAWMGFPQYKPEYSNKEDTTDKTL